MEKKWKQLDMIAQSFSEEVEIQEVPRKNWFKKKKDTFFEWRSKKKRAYLMRNKKRITWLLGYG
jgi:hypothetical protein